MPVITLHTIVVITTLATPLNLRLSWVTRILLGTKPFLLKKTIKTQK